MKAVVDTRRSINLSLKYQKGSTDKVSVEYWSRRCAAWFFIKRLTTRFHGKMQLYNLVFPLRELQLMLPAIYRKHISYPLFTCHYVIPWSLLTSYEKVPNGLMYLNCKRKITDFLDQFQFQEITEAIKWILGANFRILFQIENSNDVYNREHMVFQIT